MNLLLDTHVFLWWVDDAPELGRAARDAIADPEALVLISAASAMDPQEEAFPIVQLAQPADGLGRHLGAGAFLVETDLRPGHAA